MGFFSRIRSAARSPADRRLEAAYAEAFADAPAPMAPPSALITRPAIDWSREQPPAPATDFDFVAGYNDHTFEQFSAPQSFEGWSLARIDAAVAMMRLGTFVEASNLLVAICGFAPVLAALYQAIAPILALRWRINGGSRGIAKEIADDLSAALTPGSGLTPSPYLTQEMRGTMAIYLRMFGFCVLQHVDGDYDPVLGVRPRWTRIWEPWAVRLQRSPRKRIAWTTAGDVEILNDGKFTFVADEQEPQFTGALVALGDEAFGGKLTQSQRATWLDFFGDPKLVALLPEKVATGTEAGTAFKAAVERIYSPGGRGVLPYGSDMKAIGLTGEGSTAFRDALTDRVIHIFMVLTGSAGTIGAGGPTGAGVYVPQKGGAWSVRHDLIARPTKAIEGAINAGHIAPHLAINHRQTIAGAKRAGTWVDPVLEIAIVSPDRDERIAGEVARYKALTDQVKAEKDVGAIVDNDRVTVLAEVFEVKPFALAAKPSGAASYAYDQENGMITRNERREELGKPLDKSPQGDMTAPQYKAWLAAEASADADIEVADAAPVATDAPPDADAAPPA